MIFGEKPRSVVPLHLDSYQKPRGFPPYPRKLGAARVSPLTVSKYWKTGALQPDILQFHVEGDPSGVQSLRKEARGRRRSQSLRMWRTAAGPLRSGRHPPPVAA